jgi:hypothetical protein
MNVGGGFGSRRMRGPSGRRKSHADASAQSSVTDRRCGRCHALYQAMTALGQAAESAYQRPFKLDRDRKGASVLILGAGLAGMVAAYELRQAGYKVQISEILRARGRALREALWR